MIKFTSNNDWDFGVESVSIITSNNQLTKRASALDKLKYEKTPNQTDVHLIALGAYEGTGLNRNGDLFREKECKNKHDTFVKANRALHRHHKNKPSDPKFGNIKAAAYNDAMKRIELIVAHDNDKCADILNEIEKKGFANYSMAARIPYDVCTWCGAKARNDKERCEHIPSQLGELNKQGEVCGMDNINPNWFEISYVSRPADRIGFSLSKLASDSRIKPMLPSDYLTLYTGFQPPEDELLLSKKAADKRYLLTKLAKMEKHIDAIAHSAPRTAKDSYLKKYQTRLNDAPTLSDATIDELRKFEPHQLLRALADKGIVLRPEEFSKYVFGKRISDDSIHGMKTHLPDVFSRLDDEAGEAVNNERFEPSPMDIMPPELKKLVSGLLENHSVFSEPAARRVVRITIIKGSQPAAHDSLLPKKEKTKEAMDKELANQYAAYKLAALNYLNDNDKLNDELLWNVLIQNR